MGLIEYDGRRVFTNRDYKVCKNDIEKSSLCEGSIATAFFSKNIFRDKNFRTPRKLSFRQIRTKDPDSGLILCLDSTKLHGRISLRFPIYDWDRIMSFFQEANVSPNDIHSLNGRHVEQYHQGNFLLGISLGEVEEFSDLRPKVLY